MVSALQEWQKVRPKFLKHGVSALRGSGVMQYIRKAELKDYKYIMKIYESAQDFMIRSGNPDQWGHFYPDEDQVWDDIMKGICFLICEEEEAHGVFALSAGKEPTYQQIEDGSWLNDEPYLTIHRLAGDGVLHGMFDCVLRFCRERSDNIRIDTHESNIIMKKLVERNGFQRCGTIYVEDGTQRTAYQWTLAQSKGQ